MDEDAHADEWLMERLLDRRIWRVGRYQKEVTEYLVQWKGYRLEFNQWVSEDDISVDSIKEYKQVIGEPLAGDLN